MPSGIADLQTGVYSLWSSSGLDDAFRGMWNEADLPAEAELADYPTIHDLEAMPGQPIFPYCVLEFKDGMIKTRMSGISEQSPKLHIRDVQLTFNVHTKDRPSEQTTAKEDCATLMDAIMAVFGGHPETPPEDIPLTYGGHLITQFVSDRIIRTQLYRYQGIIQYMLRLDVPFAIQ